MHIGVCVFTKVYIVENRKFILFLIFLICGSRTHTLAHNNWIPLKNDESTVQGQGYCNLMVTVCFMKLRARFLIVSFIYLQPLQKEIGIIRQFTFSSSLQRMSVIVRMLGSQHFDLFAKGAPEKIIQLSKPDTGMSTYFSWNGEAYFFKSFVFTGKAP